MSGPTGIHLATWQMTGPSYTAVACTTPPGPAICGNRTTVSPGTPGVTLTLNPADQLPAWWARLGTPDGTLT